MRNLLNFLVKYNNLIVFLVLEGVALSLLTAGNSYHNSRIVKFTQGITLGIEERINNAKSYLNLREINSDLANENDALRNRIARMTHEEDGSFLSVTDTVFNQQYEYKGARVINNSANRQKNYFTINKGKLHGIKVDMAVAGSNGAAGVIIGVSDYYSVAISLINIDFKVSARIRSNGYFGSLGWDGHNYRQAVLNEIPQHVNVTVGDTIETTGFSALFPEGVPIGIVSDYKKSGGDFYRITVDLLTDFKNLKYVYVIGNMKKTEQLRLESQFQ